MLKQDCLRYSQNADSDTSTKPFHTSHLRFRDLEDEDKKPLWNNFSLIIQDIKNIVNEIVSICDKILNIH